MTPFFERFRTRFIKQKAQSQKERTAALDRALVTSLHEERASFAWPSWRQLRYLPEVLSPMQGLIVRVLLGVVALAIVGLVIQGYYSWTTPLPEVGGEYSEGLVGSPTTVNPLFALANDVDADISRLVFSSLFRYNEKQELVQDLIASYDVSDDEKTYTFYLRQDAVWHDGEKVTTNDVLFTLTAIQDPEYRSPLEPAVRGAKFNKIDDFTFNIELKEPFAPFLSSLTFGILPEHIWYDIPPANARLAEYNLKPIGSGPYQFKSLTKDKNGSIKMYTLGRWSSYYDQAGYLDQVKFVFYPDLTSLVDAAKNKRVTAVAFTPLSLRDEISHNKRLQDYKLRLPQYTAVFFNQKNKLLADKAVRQALAWGFSRDQMISDVLGGEGETIYSPILPGYLGYNPEVEKYGYDVEQANKLLDDAGWAFLEGDEVRHKKGQELAFALTTVDQPEYVAAANLLKEQWNQLHIRMEVNVIAASEMQSRVIKPRAYEALLFGEIIGTDPDPYPFWHSSQSAAPGLNLAVFFNKQVDQLLEEARKTSDVEQRRLKYLHFQNIVAEELPAIFLYTPVYSYHMDKSIHGVGEQYIVVPSDRLIGLVNWYQETRRVWR